MIAWPLAPPPAVVAPAGPDDWRDLAAIHAGSFAIGWSAHELVRLDADAAVTTLVARRANMFGTRRATGFVMFRRAADEAELLTIAVQQRRRGGGIGRALMDAMLRTLYAERVRKVFLEVAPDNAAALALYRRLGFRQVGERPAYYRGADGQAHHAVLLALDLAA